MIKRLAGILMLALALTAVVTAGPAAAHTLSLDKARTVAQRIGNNKVKTSDQYVKATVTAKDCKRLFPHRVRCRIGYDTSATLKNKKRYDCTERVMLIYRAHRKFGPFDPTVSYQNEAHEC